MAPALLIAMVVAVVIIMLQLGIGPFGHPSRMHWHQRFVQIAPATRNMLMGICAATLVLSITHLLGLWGAEISW